MQKSDDDLIREVLAGMRESFDQLMQNHQQNVYNIAFSFAKTSDGAMDITQTVFLKAYENLRKFRGESQFKTWLRRIAYNEGQNWIKKNKKLTTQGNIEEHQNMPENFFTQEDDLLVTENKTLLLRSLYELNTRYRLAVILRYFENYSIKEISETLQCTEGVVKNMLYRSLQKLKKILSSQEHGE